MQLVYAKPSTLEQAADALHGLAKTFLGDAPPLRFGSSAPNDVAAVINSMGALLMGWKRARERADALESQLSSALARLNASEDKLADRVRSAHTDSKQLREQLAQRDVQLQRQEKALATAAHRETQREAELRRRERELEKMQARLATCHRGARDAQLLEMPESAQRHAADSCETGIRSGPRRNAAEPGIGDDARRTIQLLASSLRASKARERYGMEEVERLTGLVENLRAAVSELSNAPQPTPTMALQLECRGAPDPASTRTDEEWMVALRRMASAQSAGPRVSLTVNVCGTCRTEVQGESLSAGKPDEDLDECKKQLREQDELLRMALLQRVPAPLRLLPLSSGNETPERRERVPKIEPPDGIEPEHGVLGEMSGRWLLHAQRQKLLANQLHQSVPNSSELAHFLDSLDEKLFTPRSFECTPSPADGGQPKEKEGSGHHRLAGKTPRLLQEHSILTQSIGGPGASLLQKFSMTLNDEEQPELDLLA